MVWVVEKKVVHHLLDWGFERVDIPVRVKLEFEVKEGCYVPDSLSFQTLYNKKFLRERYPKINLAGLESAIRETVQAEIRNHLRVSGFLDEGSSSSDLFP